MQVRDIVWFELAGKRRPGVVIEVQGDRVRVAYGTSQYHGPPCERVSEDSRPGRLFPLREPTWFYGANTSIERASNLERGSKPCSWELLNAIRKLVESHDASLRVHHIQDASGVIHLAELVYPLEGECQALTRCGRALPMPWRQVDECSNPSCMTCFVKATE